MRNVIFVLTLILVACSRNTKDEDVSVKLILCDKNTLCINICNNSNEGYYLPEARGLPAGLRVFLISDNSKFVDISDKAKVLSLECYSEKSYKTIEKCCKLTDNEGLLTIKEIDSIASTILGGIKNRDTRMLGLTFDRIKRLLNEAIFIGPKQSYNDYFPLPDSIRNKRLAIFYTFPYPYPVITTGPTTITQEQIEYNRKLIDSSRFDYPITIRGYRQYKKIIYSKPIFINN